MTEVIPFYTEILKNPLGMCTVYIAKGILREAAKSEDVQFVVLHPRDSGEFSRPEDYWGLEGEGTEFFLYDQDSTTSPTLGFANASIAKLASRKDYFVVLNQKVTASLMLKRILAKPFAGFHPEIVNFAVVGDLNETHISMFPSLKEELLASYAMFWNIFVSEGHLARTKKAMMQIYNPSVVSRFMKRSTYVNHGANITNIMSAVPATKSRKFVVMFGGRAVEHKGIEKMAEACRYVVSVSGEVLKLELFLITGRTAGAEKRIKELRKDSFVTVHEDRPHEEFYGMCQVADAFIAPSTAEAYGISYVEMMSCGVIGVFYDRPWIYSIIPAGYPFVVKSTKEAANVLMMLMEGKYFEWRNRLKKFIRDKHSAAAHDRRIIELVSSLSAAKRLKKKIGGWEDVL